MYVLDAGRLKKRISIYGYQEVTDDLGQKSTRIVKKASVFPSEVCPQYPGHGISGILPGCE